MRRVLVSVICTVMTALPVCGGATAVGLAEELEMIVERRLPEVPFVTGRGALGLGVGVGNANVSALLTEADVSVSVAPVSGAPASLNSRTGRLVVVATRSEFAATQPA